MPQQLQLNGFNLDGYNVFSQGLHDPTARGLILYIAADINSFAADFLAPSAGFLGVKN